MTPGVVDPETVVRVAEKIKKEVPKTTQEPLLNSDEVTP
jgi:hypothetical protein